MYVQYGTWPTSQSHRPPTTSPSPSTASPPGTIIFATTRWTKAPTRGNPFFSSFTFDTHGTVQTCSAPASSPFCLALRPDVRVLLVSRGGLRLQRPWSPPPSLPQRLPRCATTTTTTNTMPVRMNLKLKVLVCGITKSAMYALFFLRGGRCEVARTTRRVSSWVVRLCQRRRVDNIYAGMWCFLEAHY